MSRDLTDKAIESSKKAEQTAAKPVLSTQIFLENVTKLKNHFDEIDNFRAQVSKEALEERKLFDDAKTKLDNMKVMNKNDVNLLDETLVK
jgi:hemerythrin superfamily protein